MEPLRVLIVDDELEFVTALVERLSFRRIYAEGALRGEQAIVKLSLKPFDIVLLDVKMPGWGCRKVIDKIAEIRPETKIILVTGYGSNLEAEKDLLENIYTYFAKPIDIDELITTMKEAAQKQN